MLDGIIVKIYRVSSGLEDIDICGMWLVRQNEVLSVIWIFDLVEWCCHHQRTYSDTENFRLVIRQLHYDQTDYNKDVRFEDLDIHYR
jgi:hypothetical protein